MAKQKIFDITPIYCDSIPKQLKEGELYISKKFNTAVHLCCCGCKGETVTPLNRWNLTGSNKVVSLSPSIGNWSGERKYHAHYFITNNKVKWC